MIEFNVVIFRGRLFVVLLWGAFVSLFDPELSHKLVKKTLKELED